MNRKLQQLSRGQNEPAVQSLVYRWRMEAVITFKHLSSTAGEDPFFQPLSWEDSHCLLMFEAIIIVQKRSHNDQEIAT